MEKALFLQYPMCDTCKRAGKWLKQNEVLVESREIAKEQPTRAELADWIERSGLPITKFFNTSGKIYIEEKLKDVVKTASKDELLDILASNGMVVKRPILVSDKLVLVGFNEKEWSEKLR